MGLGERSGSKMIFIVGNSRSGTTMLGRILGMHRLVYTFGELHFFEQLVEEKDLEADVRWDHGRLITLAETLITRSRKGFFAAVKPGEFHHEANDLIAASATTSPRDLYFTFLGIFSRNAGKLIPCEQTPRYLFFSNKILDVFPDAVIINLVRDPRDVVLSQKSKWKRRFLGGTSIPVREALRAWSNYHPYIVCKLWNSNVDYAMSINDDRFLSVRFEDLLEDSERQLRIICDFAGLEFESHMLDTPQLGSSSSRDSEVKLGIDKRRAGGWRRSRMPNWLRGLCEWVSYDRMKRMGYDDFLYDGKFSFAIVLPMLGLPFKLILALAFNLRRFSNLVNSLRRRIVKPRTID